MKINKRSQLEAIYREYCGSVSIPSDVNFVGGFGDLNASLVLVGEAPGRMENAKRQPFVGPSGVQLTKILDQLGIDPFHTFQTNIVKFWPKDKNGQTRQPTEQEIEDSKLFLMKEIDVIAPKLVALCGISATRAIFPEVTSMRSVNGKLLNDYFVPVFHPATLLHDLTGGSDRSTEVWNGYKALRKHLRTMSG